jgi:hypothetical protein
MMLVATAVTLVVYYSLDYPGLSPAIPLAVALYSATVLGWVWASVGVSTFFVVAGVLVLGLHQHHADRCAGPARCGCVGRQRPTRGLLGAGDDPPSQ